jgi:restriction endonuclease Mrr
MQKFVGMIYAYHRADQGIFVTTSSFTQPALTLALQQNIKTLDGKELVALVQQWHHSIKQEQEVLPPHHIEGIP